MAAVLAGMFLVGWASVAYADLNCSDFPSQAAAQANLRANPTDPNRLDADNNGIACQVSPYPAGSATDFNAVNRSGAVTATTQVTIAPAATVTTVRSAAAVAAVTTPRPSGLATTGLNHTRQLVELALVFLGLGSALVLEMRARNGLDRLRRH